MVSALWKACSQGDLETALHLLKDASSLDIEIKDQAGATPLIEAVKSGNSDIVKALLDKGADPNNGSTQGRPEQFTSDSTILELLAVAQRKVTPNGVPVHESRYPYDVPQSDTNGSASYYPPNPYGYFPATVPPGAMYYPPFPLTGDPNGPGNLPPPEVAQFIPCRYFPACRYGSSCMFAHPPGPYIQGQLPPPAQYPAPYDPSTNQHQQHYPPNYYSNPPQFSDPASGVPPHMSPASPMSPQSGAHHPLPSPAVVHARQDSEPPIPTHFASNGPPSMSPYNPVPPSYPHSGHVPVPLSMTALPPLHHAPPPAPQSPPTIYGNGPHGHTTPFTARPDSLNRYPPMTMPGRTDYPDVNGEPKSPAMHTQTDSYATNLYGTNRSRQGGFRRGSFAGRRPSCLFFPSGRCRNGDDCRFPHVIPEGIGSQNSPSSGKPGARPRGMMNGVDSINDKFSGMTVSDGNHTRQRGGETPNRSHSTEAGGRQRFKVNHVSGNGPRADKKLPAKQRVPNPDEFPVLSGSVTPPTRSPGANGFIGSMHSGPTAAQVLQAPAPTHRDNTKDSSTRGGTPESTDNVKGPKSEVNGILSETSPEPMDNKLPLSFASIATSGPDVSKEVSVSA